MLELWGYTGALGHAGAQGHTGALGHAGARGHAEALGSHWSFGVMQDLYSCHQASLVLRVSSEELLEENCLGFGPPEG